MTKYLSTLRDKTRISLNKEKREQEQDKAQETRLGLENTRRKAKGIPPAKDLDEIEENKEEREDKKAQEDPVLIESGNILVDLMSISSTLENKGEMAGKN